MNFLDLDTPAIQVCGLSIWVSGRAYPDAEIAFDKNYLKTIIICSSALASVRVDEPTLMVNQIDQFAEQCETLYRDMAGEAVLDPYGRNLKVTIRPSDALGHLVLSVEITPDHLAQQHRFDFGIDQSFLPQLISQCRKVVDEYPIK